MPLPDDAVVWTDPAQRTPDWFALRAGRLTSSDAATIYMAGRGGGESVTLRDLRVRLAAERLAGGPVETDRFVSSDMARGAALEADARAEYEALTGNLTRTVSFVLWTDVMIGASPDAVVGDFEGLVEIKCPKTTTHLGYLRDGVPEKYLHQMRHQALVTGVEWIDFVSFDPRLPPDQRIFHVRYCASALALDAHEARVAEFLVAVDAEVTRIALSPRRVGEVIE